MLYPDTQKSTLLQTDGKYEADNSMLTQLKDSSCTEEEQAQTPQ